MKSLGEFLYENWVGQQDRIGTFLTQSPTMRQQPPL